MIQLIKNDWIIYAYFCSHLNYFNQKKKKQTFSWSWCENRICFPASLKCVNLISCWLHAHQFENACEWSSSLFFLLSMSTYRRTQQINTLSVSRHSKSVVPLLDIHQSPALMNWLSTDSISLCASLWASDVLTPPQWKDQLSSPLWVGFHEKLSGLALTHVSILAAAYRKSCYTVTSAPELTTEDISAFSHKSVMVKSPSCDTNTLSICVTWWWFDQYNNTRLWIFRFHLISNSIFLHLEASLWLPFYDMYRPTDSTQHEAARLASSQ